MYIHQHDLLLLVTIEMTEYRVRVSIDLYTTEESERSVGRNCKITGCQIYRLFVLTYVSSKLNCYLSLKCNFLYVSSKWHLSMSHDVVARMKIIRVGKRSILP